MGKLALNITQNWPFRRILGLLIGLFVAFQAYIYKDTLLAVLSSFFLFQIATNTGCFGTTACSIDFPKSINEDN